MNGSWSKIMHWLVEDGYLVKMKGAPLSVYCALLKYTSYDFKPVFPKKERLEKETGYSIPQITRAIKRLRKLGLVAVGPTITKNGQKSNQYHFQQPNLPEFLGVITDDQAARSPMIRPRGDHPRSGPYKEQEDSNKNNNNNSNLKRRVIHEEYYDPTPTLENAVVVILEKLGIKLQDTSAKFKKELFRTDVEILKHYYEQAEGANRSSSGFFVSAVERGFEPSSSGRRQIEKDSKMASLAAFEEFGHNVRRKVKNLRGINGKEYEVTNNTVAPLVLRDEQWTALCIHTQEQFDTLFPDFAESQK